MKLSGGSSPLGGGAVFNNGGTLTITNSAITGNLAGYGGGIHNSAGSSFTLTGSSVSGNKAVNSVDEGIGGGISNHGTLTVENSLITKNVASGPNYGGYGGGIANYGTATVSNSLVSGATRLVAPPTMRLAAAYTIAGTSPWRTATLRRIRPRPPLPMTPVTEAV